MKKLFLLLSLLVGYLLNAQDSIILSSMGLDSLFTLKANQSLYNNAAFSPSDKVAGVYQKPFGTVVQAKLSKFQNGFLTATKFNDGTYSARIIKDSTLYYQWGRGYLIKGSSPLTFYNGEALQIPNSFPTFRLPDIYYSPSLTKRQKDSIMITNGGVCIFYCFAGTTVRGTAWNWSGDLTVGASSLNSNPAMQDSAVAWAQLVYQPFNVVVTKDTALYLLAKRGRRVMVIFTPDCAWYSCAYGGVSYNNSMFWGDDSPSFAFDLVGNDRMKACVGIHESGHQFGLQHQGTHAPAEYNGGFGSGETGFAPIMGVPYSKNVPVWWNGDHWFGGTAYAQQSDIEYMSTGLNLGGSALYKDGTKESYGGAGVRLGDAGNTFNTSKLIQKDQVFYAFVGAKDSDYYKIIIPSTQTVTINVQPIGVSFGANNVYATNSNATLDAAFDLYDGNRNLITSGLNSATLNASLTQSLAAGTYFVKIRGDRTNPNNPSGYGFMGRYFISYTF